MFAFSSTASTPNDLPTPGGPDTIIPRTVPSIVASVISSRISNRSRISFIRSSSVCSFLSFSAFGTIGSYPSLPSLIRIFLSGYPATLDPSTVINPPRFPNFHPLHKGNTVLVTILPPYSPLRTRTFRIIITLV